MAARLASIDAAVESMPVDDLLAALSGSGILDTLVMTNEDLLLAHSDSDLLATLKITYEFSVALRNAEVLDIFFKLPRVDQANFLRWIGTTADRDLRRDRTQTFIAALHSSPLGDAGTHRGTS